jgi:hypothetical protein
MTGRKAIGRSTEQEVLVLSKRRCCVCYALNSDAGEKKGQIAHLDSNAARSDFDNLVFLCLDHHDSYDSSSSQAKGLRPGEVREYRQDLYEFNSQEPIRCGLVLEIDREFDQYSRSEQKNLLKAITSLSGVGSGVRVVSTSRGSVRITLELTLDQARSIVNAVKDGKLDAYSVKGAEIICPDEGSSELKWQGATTSKRQAFDSAEPGRRFEGGRRPGTGTKKIYVGNLNIETTVSTLQTLFSVYGNISSASVLADRETGRSRGFGFVEMDDEKEALAAIQALDGKTVDGRVLKVNEAMPKTRGKQGPGSGRW